MSNFNSTATSTIYVNGQPAKQEIAKLKKEIVDYRDQLQRIATDKSLGVNSKQWRDVRQRMLDAEKELGRIQSGVANVTQVMLRLDKATPNELRKSLKQLKNDLDNIERGSRAWDEHQRKIKAIKSELAKINAESKVQLSLWGRFAKKMFEWGTAIQTVMATITSVTLTIRQSVKAFAEMDQEMANVRKYTGMTADEVERLNGEFKTMDTRSSREQLNKLAQEAGRLGMQSQEDVMGFVRAADKINVALDDLGEDATLTLSKLTDIFGDRQRLGVEKSLLSVGSVINELSQNCTASAPYLAEFASRMGGVGAQAGMTTQQIMGFGAVLDAYNQKVESSSTALSQVIVRLYREPEKYAKVAGLEVKQFAELMKTDMNAALIQFLEALNKAGGMDVLSPMFKDMGENGARAIQALSTLATHIDEVKNQQEVANEAFSEAVSIDKEFNVQNNTVQAGLEKAKKNFNEMAVTLGEKLAPLMRYTITSSGAFMRAIAEVVDFIGNHKTAIVNTTIALTSFTVAVNASTLATKLHALGSKMAAAATTAWNGILTIGTAIQKTFTAAVAYGHVALTLFSKGATAARIEFAALNATIKANPFGLLLTVITAVVLAIVNLKGKTDEYTKAAKENLKAAKGLSEEYYKEQRELDVLFGKLEGAKKGTKEYESAKKSIISQYGRYLSGLIDEKGEIINLTGAYDRLTAAIRRSARERGIAAAREKNTEEYFSTLSNDLKELQDALERTGASTKEAARIVQKVSDAATSGKALDKNTSDWIRAYSSRDGWNNVFSPGKTPWGIANKIFNRNDEYNKSERTFTAMEQAVAPYKNIPEDRLSRSLVQLDKIILSGKAGEALVIVGGDSADEYRKVSVKEAKSLVQGIREELNYRRGNSSSSTQPENTPPGSSYTPTLKSNKNSGHQKTEDKFKAEKEWREYEEALNRIAYATGQKNYEDYTKRMLKIEEQFYKEQLKHADLTKNERIVISAQLAEVQRKQVETANKFTIEEENKAYADRKAITQQMYLDGLLTAEQYNKQMELSELQHLKNIRDIYKGQAETAIKEWEDVRQKAAEQMQSLYKGNVDLLNRPVIDAHELTKAGWSGNPTQPGEATATVYSSQYGIKDASGAVKEILVTPILPDGSVLSEKQLEEYIQTKLEGAENILAADDKGIVIAVDVSTDGKAGEDLHKLQEAFYSLKPNVDEKAWENYLKANATYREKLVADQVKNHQEYEQKEKEHQKKLADAWEEYAYDQKEKQQKVVEETKKLIEAAYKAKLAELEMDESLTPEDRSKKIAELTSRYQKAIQRLTESIKGDKGEKSLGEWMGSLLDKMFGEGTWDKYGDLVKNMAASVMSVWSNINQLWEAEEQQRLADLEKRYDREISMAEGNAYKIKEIERKKQKEEARLKAEASKKQFAQQVISAIAQTATAALNAYATAPAPTMIWGPIAAAMATAAGLVQIAAIKKQQSISAAQGYAEGGFTPDGPKDKPVGIVHAGEWVASQKLLKNPATRPAIEALDFAQRNNRFGDLPPAAVTRIVTAPAVMAQAATDGSMSRAIAAMSLVMGEYSETMEGLRKRLEKPFVTVNTVSGDLGMKKAQDEFTQLENNTLPKSKRK